MNLITFWKRPKKTKEIQVPALDELLHKVQQNLSSFSSGKTTAKTLRLKISFITEKARRAQQFSELLINENWENDTYFKHREVEEHKTDPDIGYGYTNLAHRRPPDPSLRIVRNKLS